MQIINDALDRKARTLWTALPGIIVDYDIGENKATVKPLLKDTPPGGEPEEMPEIPDVPVIWPRVGLAVMYMPLREGDKVAIFFSTRPLDKWEAGDGNTPVDPQDPRHHALSDAFIVPGLYPFGDPIPAPRDPADIRIILYDTSGNPRSQFYLGGDTGDIVMIPEHHGKLGSATAGKGVARLNDPTLSTGVEDATYWAWLAGFISVFQAWTPVPNDGGAALKSALTTWLAGNPVPTQLVGKINGASTVIFAED